MLTATVLAFPTLLERDEMEFERKGVSNYTRAFAEAATLWEVVKAPRNRDEVARRVEVFAGAVERLSQYRPECLGDEVPVRSGGIELRLMPDVLRLALATAAT